MKLMRPLIADGVRPTDRLLAADATHAEGTEM